MGPQFIVKKDVESVYFKANVPIFVASLICSSDLGFVGYTSLYNYIFDSIHDLFKINSIFVEPVTELVEIPFGGVFSIISLSSATFNVIFSFLVHRVISEMYKAFLKCLRVVRVLLSSKSNKTFLEEEDFERIEARYQDVNS